MNGCDVTDVLSLNPSTGQARALGFAETTPAQVLAMAAAAAEAAHALAARGLAWRADLLRAMADSLEADTEQLVALADAETALGPTRLGGELRRTAFQLRFFADVVADGWFLGASVDHPTDSPMGPLPDLRRYNVPLGPVGVFAASNFPFAFSVPGGDTASAIAAGCPVVVKAHPGHPATSVASFEALARAARSAGAPDGTIDIVFGFDAGLALVDAPQMTGIGFTGSVIAGRALLERVHARPVPIPFYGELGSANPLVVTPAAAAERAEEIGATIAGSVALGVGQFCTKPGLLFVPADASGDTVVAALAAALAAAPAAATLTPTIAANFARGATAIHATIGVRALVPAQPVEQGRVTPALYETDVEHFAANGAAILRDECFGPIAVVVRYDSAVALARGVLGTDPALTFSVFTAATDDDAPRLIELGAERAGRVIVNAVPTGVGVSWSQQHGGPWPATTASASTSVGAGAIARWLRPVTYQGAPDRLLPDVLKESNPLGVPRRVDGRI
jgi:NADP-dependent aldehyde dehydrogenase